MPSNIDFDRFAERKIRDATHAVIPPLVTVDDRSSQYPVQRLGTAWTRRHFDGDFYLFEPPQDLPAVSLIFVQSREGNTVAADPASLGGGPVDYHVIFEGVSRVAADGVLAGATTVGRKVFFSVWHPEMVALRHELGLPRHPAQIVVSRRGHINVEESRIFNVPEVRVFVLLGAEGQDQCRRALNDRSWITVVPLHDDDLTDAFRRLRHDHGITRISCIGGRTVAASLVDAGLVQDLCLTTSGSHGGVAHSGWYGGSRPPALDLVVRKEGMGETAPITFDHLAVTSG